MNDLLLGRFPAFEGTDTVLLSCTSKGVERLLAVLKLEDFLRIRPSPWEGLSDDQRHAILRAASL